MLELINVCKTFNPDVYKRQTMDSRKGPSSSMRNASAADCCNG